MAHPEQLPMLHRGMMQLGLLVVFSWIVMQLLIPLAEPSVSMAAERSPGWSIFFLVIGTVFVAFGFVCEMILGMTAQHGSHKIEQERMAELSGRTRFRRPVKTYKRICVTPEELRMRKEQFEEFGVG